MIIQCEVQGETEHNATSGATDQVGWFVCSDVVSVFVLVTTSAAWGAIDGI